MAMAPQQLGIGIRRHFTRPGVDPYDTVEWERRDARIPNFKDGGDAFFQAGVEFPTSWSLNATNIVAQKYFRGTLGTPEREWSLRQVIDRVVDTITDWGVRDGYFVDAGEAETFRDELKHVLVHQRAAFNSPVWFNIGVKGVPQQASACQPYDAPVATPDGFVPIGKLVEDDAVGTKVFDAQGITRIVAVKSNGVKSVLRVHTKDGTKLDVTPDHLVWRTRRGGKSGWAEAEQLRPGDRLHWHGLDALGGALVHTGEIRVLEIARVQAVGAMPVYDIQTESGEYLSEHVRVHNCFILSVDDTMDDILNWYREEGIIFKGGSGAGVNLSRIRSSRELLNGGGTASGPVSFMRGADASAGTIKSGGKTRRAAKMVILDADHPDIEDFVWCKAIEERKARALAEAGFDMDLDGRDSHSVQYQNENNSVRVTEEFMQAVTEDRDWTLRAVTDGQPVKTMKARDLMRQIAQSAWECADPGMQFDTTINRWHTASNTGRINASNPCSEYMHLDNSACNLASINLLKFVQDDDVFDVEGFRRTVEVVFTAQEILVGNADYPTERIAQTSREFRQLGLGYANLGALLMAQGLPYDSDDGRAWASAITALMTGHAYATSARTAARMGPFAGYAENEQPMLNVLRMHRAEAAKIDEDRVPPELLCAAQEAWDEAVELGERHGVRNSQSTVLAPTGTIGLMMDCDTTGIEPDLALTKAKKLVGGGTMLIVNQTVPRALRKLGYTGEEVDRIVGYIDEHKTIVGAPLFKDEHLPVFACSMGDNTIHYMGHIRMMAAAQPWISGAISKTANLPEDVSVEEVEQVYIESWRLGLKAVALYRDNCKVGQPLATQKAAGVTQEVERIVETVIVQEPVRQKLPKVRSAKTFSFRVADCHGYVTVGEYEDGRPGELFLQVAKQGSTLAGIMDAFAISVSHGLQYGVPLEAFVEMFTNMRFEPAGMTDDPDIRFATSLIDYIFRRLAVEYLPLEKREAMGIMTVGERLQPTLPGVEESTTPMAPSLDLPPEDRAPSASMKAHPAGSRRAEPPQVRERELVLCHVCGDIMQRAGSCYACPSCGSTSGCS
ncbi:MAG TPA: vitamin B12-dependent ribonucleotide reductase [Acidimicrobiia bacterium]|nr:vitamin B12-dependent ribonucleotide reductase [Acidimicrobiia bacterium]